MNSLLKEYAHNFIRESLAQLPASFKEDFYQSFGLQNGARTIEEAKKLSLEQILSEIPDYRLDWAVQKVENSVKGAGIAVVISNQSRVRVKLLSPEKYPLLTASIARLNTLPVSDPTVATVIDSRDIQVLNGHGASCPKCQRSAPKDEIVKLGHCNRCEFNTAEATVREIFNGTRTAVAVPVQKTPTILSKPVIPATSAGRHQTVEEMVFDFAKAHVNKSFNSSDICEYVWKFDRNIAPETPNRVLRKLKTDGKVDYATRENTTARFFVHSVKH